MDVAGIALALAGRDQRFPRFRALDHRSAISVELPLPLHQMFHDEVRLSSTRNRQGNARRFDSGGHLLRSSNASRIQRLGIRGGQSVAGLWTFCSKICLASRLLRYSLVYYAS